MWGAPLHKCSGCLSHALAGSLPPFLALTCAGCLLRCRGPRRALSRRARMRPGPRHACVSRRSHMRDPPGPTVGERLSRPPSLRSARGWARCDRSAATQPSGWFSRSAGGSAGVRGTSRLVSRPPSLRSARGWARRERSAATQPSGWFSRSAGGSAGVRGGPRDIEACISATVGPFGPGLGSLRPERRHAAVGLVLEVGRGVRGGPRDLEACISATVGPFGPGVASLRPERQSASVGVVLEVVQGVRRAW